jgi:8-oxo-dGTP diphosphatase
VLTVVAALIMSNGKLLVCQRCQGGPFELMWEFPGGKRKTGETLEQALTRELREELGVEALVGPELYRTRHRYAHMKEPIELIFFQASAAAADMRNLVFERMEWREPESLASLNFLPADRELVEMLAKGTLSIPPLQTDHK